MLYLGIDVGKSQHSAALIDAVGKTVATLPSLENAAAGFQELLSFISGHVPTGENLQIGVEATGPYWIPLARWLKERGFEVVILNPLKVASLRNYGVRGSKTDRIDAVLVAQALRWEGHLPQAARAGQGQAASHGCGDASLCASSVRHLEGQSCLPPLDTRIACYETVASGVPARHYVGLPTRSRPIKIFW